MQKRNNSKRYVDLTNETKYRWA